MESLSRREHRHDCVDLGGTTLRPLRLVDAKEDRVAVGRVEYVEEPARLRLGAERVSRCTKS
jgi:hypothetical protein